MVSKKKKTEQQTETVADESESQPQSTPSAPEGQEPKKKRTTKSKRAGILFSVSRSRKHIAKHIHKNGRIGETAPVFLAAVGAYLIAEIADVMLEDRQGELRTKSTKVRLMAQNFTHGLAADEEFAKLLSDVQYTEYNIIPDTVPHLMNLYHEKAKKSPEKRPSKVKAEKAAKRQPKSKAISKTKTQKSKSKKSKAK